MLDQSKNVASNLVIWGAGGHALVVADIVRCQGGYTIAGFLDDANPARRGQPFSGAAIFGGREQLGSLRSAEITHAIIAIGDCAVRLALADVAISNGLTLVSAIHPRAVIAADVVIGDGTVVAAGAVINPGTKIGRNAIVNTSASIDHECDIEDGAHICPGARLGGNVRVGRGAWVGIGATVLPGVVIGQGATVGAGAVVLKDIPPSVVAFGVPARIRGESDKS
jgi:acetyltransferase EpsM